MRARTLLALVVVVAGLFLLWRAKARETERGGPELAQYPLLPDLATERVRALRIDHLERSIQIQLERDSAGRWYLTDPVAYPAQDALVRSLFRTLEQAQGEPASDVVPSEAGLDPPTVVLECRQGDPDPEAPGGERTLRLELGSVSLDPARIFVRVPGHPAAGAAEPIFRSVRTLLTTLDRNPDDYRDARATSLLVQQVSSFRRRGEVFLAEEGRRVELGFDALLEPEGWKQVFPVVVSLHPSGFLLLARGAAELTVSRFVDDAPRSLARYGLDPPAFTIELGDERSQTTTLRFGHVPADLDRPVEELTWFAQREGFDHVWEVSTQDVALLCRPAHFVYDYDVLRVFRQDVQRLELVGGGSTRIMERDEEAWTVQELGPDDTPEAAPRYPANPPAVEAALALLERTELGDYQPGVEFVEEDPPLAFAVQTKSGARVAARIGRAWRDERTGVQGHLFLRPGDQLVGLVGVELAELCARPLDELRARRIHQLQESLVRSIELEHAGQRFTFVNTGDNRWRPRDRQIAAPADFVQSLDALLNLQAERWLETDEEASLEDELGVRLQTLGGEERRFRLGRDESGSALWVAETRERAVIDAAPLERLLRLFEHP